VDFALARKLIVYDANTRRVNLSVFVAKLGRRYNEKVARKKRCVFREWLNLVMNRYRQRHPVARLDFLRAPEYAALPTGLLL
jgi:hypothetical protein